MLCVCRHPGWILAGGCSKCCLCSALLALAGGVFLRVNGDRYEGEWRNGRMHGKGVKVMANGDVYNGTWENDKAEGNGVKVRRCALVVLGLALVETPNVHGLVAWGGGHVASNRAGWVMHAAFRAR